MTRYLAGLAVGTVLALGYVQQRVCLVRLGYEVESTAGLRDELLDQNRVLQYNVLALQSPVILEGRLAQSDVRLAPPTVVEVLSPSVSAVSPAPLWEGSSSDSSWLDQVWTFTSRWLEKGSRQAVAAPVREARAES